MNTIILNYLLDDENKGPDRAPPSAKPGPSTRKVIKRVPLTTKKAVEFFLNGTLNNKVCKYCLNVTSQLSEVGQILKVAGRGVLYDISIRDMINNVYPFQITEDPNFPSKICNHCLDLTLSAYLFAQRCEQTERAIKNCFAEINERFDKLDPLDNLNMKRRGRKKNVVNNNVLFASHENVIDYAEPLINLINRGSAFLDKDIDPEKKELECPKCWLVLPNVESLINHKKSHPASMWYHCRLCGNSFSKSLHLKKHLKICNTEPFQNNEASKRFICQDCGAENETYIRHLQHVEKHKFKQVVDNLMVKGVDDLCAICFDKGKNMEKLENTVALHGNCQELNGDKSLYKILGSTLPGMLSPNTGTKICMKCLDDALHSYVFINKSIHIRRRLNTCVTAMLDTLESVKEPENNIFIEVSDNLILPAHDLENNTNDYLDDDINTTELKIDVLEDEFRKELSSESEEEIMDMKIQTKIENFTDNMKVQKSHKVKTESSKDKKQYNGFCKPQSKHYINQVCNEFLTFKNKNKTKENIKFTCPLCSKCFLNAYYLNKHTVKHIKRTVECKICKKGFISKFSLEQHHKFAHLLNNDKYVSCDICGRTYTDILKYNLHKKSHYFIQCHLCNKFFRTQRLFDTHLQRHALKIKIQSTKDIQTCSFCEKELWSDNDLSFHVNKDHLQIKPFNCNMCEKQFYTRKNMIDHKIVHSVICKEKCEFCDKVLKCRKDLVRHLKKHIG